MITWLCLKSNYLHIMCDIDLKVIILYLTVVARDAELVECLDKCQKKGHSGSKCQKRCYPTVRQDYSMTKVRRLLNHYCHPETHSVNGKGHMFFSGDGPREFCLYFIL